MKILTIEQIREADAYTISHEPIKSIDLMERAASKCFEWIIEKLNPGDKILVVCGPGNNGGDGLALSRMLYENHFQVDVSILRFTDQFSYDCEINIQRLNDIDLNVHQVTEADKLIIEKDVTIIVDAVFGSGLSRPVSGFVGECFDKINESGRVVISVDIPSGLYADKNTPIEGKVVKADYTLSFELPKLTFLLPQNEIYIGDWQILPIGLNEEFIASQTTNYEIITTFHARAILKDRQKFSHKGTYGHALLVAGSSGKMGAAVLSSSACLRSGVGLLTACVPNGTAFILNQSIPECMSIEHNDDFYKAASSNYNVVGIGPGLGVSKGLESSLKVLIQNSVNPILLDADALNIIAENKTWLSFLPKNSILTPHPGEFRRIAGNWENDFEKIELQRSLSQKHNIYIVLKGAHSSIACPDGRMFFNSTGNPGMATAGSGDILTGIILALMAQKYHPEEACLLGVYIHGLAGDIALFKQSLESLIASDIIDNLGEAFKDVEMIMD